MAQKVEGDAVAWRMTQSRRLKVLFSRRVENGKEWLWVWCGENRAPPVADCCNEGSLNQEGRRTGTKVVGRCGRERDAIFGGVVQRDRIRWFE